MKAFLIRTAAVAILFPLASVAVAFWWQYRPDIAGACLGLFSWEDSDRGARALDFIIFAVSLIGSIVLVIGSIIGPILCDLPGTVAPKPPSE